MQETTLGPVGSRTGGAEGAVVTLGTVVTLGSLSAGRSKARPEDRGTPPAAASHLQPKIYQQAQISTFLVLFGGHTQGTNIILNLEDKQREALTFPSAETESRPVPALVGLELQLLEEDKTARSLQLH